MQISNQKNPRVKINNHHILYPLRLGSPFPNNDYTLRPKVDLGPNLEKS